MAKGYLESVKQVRKVGSDMKEYLSIKEFSKLSGLEQSTLRYWDDIGLFTPEKRNPENNYRYYTPEQIIAVNFITVLSSLNIQQKTISNLEETRTPDVIVDLIENQERRLDLEMSRLRDCYSVMHTRRELINYAIRLENGYRAVNGIRVDADKSAKEGEWIDENSIMVLHRDERPLIIGTRNIKKNGEPFYGNFVRFCDKAVDTRMNLNFPIGGLHDSFDSFLAMPGEPDHYFSLDPSGKDKRKEGKYLIGFHRGYYGDFGDLPERMKAYADKKSLKPHGPLFAIYLLDEVCEKNPSKYLAQVCVAV